MRFKRDKIKDLTSRFASREIAPVIKQLLDDQDRLCDFIADQMGEISFPFDDRAAELLKEIQG